MSVAFFHDNTSSEDQKNKRFLSFGNVQIKLDENVQIIAMKEMKKKIRHEGEEVTI